jgi:hypothetical protein
MTGLVPAVQGNSTPPELDGSAQSPLASSSASPQAQQSQAQQSQAQPSQAQPSEAQPSRAQPSEAPQSRAQPSEAIVDGVDVDAVAAAVRACPAVDDLYSSTTEAIASYLPGRRVTGVRVGDDFVLVSVRLRWGVPVPELAAQLRGTVSALVAPRRLDIVVADVSAEPCADQAPAGASGGG